MVITTFDANGKLGTKKNLFANAMASMGDASFESIYGSLAPVLARQFVNYPDTPINPLTTAFIGEALEYGDIIEDVFVDATPMRATKTALSGANALGSAEDELAFANVNMRVSYATINAMNTGKVSKYRSEIRKAAMDSAVAGRLGDSIMESLRAGAVACLENQANKVLVSSIPEANNVYCGVTSDDTATAAIKKERTTLIQTAIEMSKVNDSFVQEVNGSKYADGAAKEVYIIATKEKWADFTLDMSGIYHPEYLVFDEFTKYGIKMTPIMVDEFETPVTETEIANYKTLTGIEWDDAPGVGQAKPDFIICDKRFFRINPYIDRYEMYSKDVVANVPYTNFFLHMQNAISYQPNRKAAMVYVGEEPSDDNAEPGSP